MIKQIIFFDIDDTLYRRSAPFKEAAEVFFAGSQSAGDTGDIFCRQTPPLLSGNIPVGFWEQAFSATQKRCEEVYFPVLRGEMTEEEGFIYRFQKGFEDVGVFLDRQQALAFRDAYQEAQKHIRMDPVAEKVLTACRQVCSGIGLITNGKGPRQRAKIGQLGLLRWVDEDLIVVSGEIGIDKPDPRIFRYAEKMAGAEPGQLIYVGDSVENDILPARRAGWSAVLWDRTEPEKILKELMGTDR